jgi:hypothetical protein
MATYKANMTFIGNKEYKTFEANVPFEMSEERAAELVRNIQNNFPNFELERLDKDLSELTVKELKELLDEEGIEYQATDKKADLIKLAEV